jgi:hypothetical protein
MREKSTGTKRALPLMVMILSLGSMAFGQRDADVFLREEFDSLDRWSPFFFEKIPEHTVYEVVSEGGVSMLRARSEGSASALILKERFDVYKFPRLRWRWKVSNVFQKGNALTKEGDDYPLRIYVIFRYDPDKAGFWERLKYSSAKLIYGEYPPHSSLNYIWANRPHKDQVLTSPYTGRSKMIPLRFGQGSSGRWFVEEVNILKDYRRAFGQDPPSIASLAIMSDSDNTGEKVVSYIDFIEIFGSKEEEEKGR